jgi:DNA-binding transcriptional LysR family regulator
MQLRHLEVFHAVMLTGTISSAARLLNISQPAVTRLLLRAEDQLGYKLFDRVKGRLAATREAQILYAESGRVLTGLENLRKLSRSLGTAQAGFLRIAAAPSLCVDLIPLAITRLRKKNPNARFSVEARQYSDLLRVVLTHEVDIGFGLNAQSHPGLDIEPLSQARFYGIFPAAAASRLPRVANAAVFRRYPYIGLSSEDPLGPTSSARLNAALKVSNFKLLPIVEVKTNQIAVSLVQRGAGAAIVDQYTAAASDLTRVVVRQLSLDVTYTVNTMRARHQPSSLLAKEFVAVLAQTEREVSRRLLATLP